MTDTLGQALASACRASWSASPSQPQQALRRGLSLVRSADDHRSAPAQGPRPRPRQPHPNVEQRGYTAGTCSRPMWRLAGTLKLATFSRQTAVQVFQLSNCALWNEPERLLELLTEGDCGVVGRW
eukprot:CAMPEP_0203875932 /NCGR_PEP_ID=MMETSP0359-20131031/21073_1 /ASSEMBLY_ACC=CAM_ASM_000338 /TAXON_ID=268821 /ORGANISM="Scrippsiella Hangoei, Strain SHTV-5" /LENGTH=124 /DNA_ID=CAMNT_0050794755 /DNA_START=94 /DNA_END=465 /DNA_ORIENTATION=-